jgi:hypothetical protein
MKSEVGMRSEGRLRREGYHAIGYAMLIRTGLVFGEGFAVEISVCSMARS